LLKFQQGNEAGSADRLNYFCNVINLIALAGY
jgi:hypothetical protein